MNDRNVLVAADVNDGVLTAMVAQALQVSAADLDLVTCKVGVADMTWRN